MEHTLLRRLNLWYGSQFPPHVKRRTFFTLVAFWWIVDTKLSAGPFFTAVWAAGSVLLILLASYEWALFLRARKDGSNTDRNLLLQESAGPLRKAVFCASVLAHALVGRIVLVDGLALKYAVDIGAYFQQFGIAFLNQVALWPMLLELWRMMNASSWSPAKHLALVLGIPALISVLQVIGFYAIWGHSLLWR